MGNDEARKRILRGFTKKIRRRWRPIHSLQARGSSHIRARRDQNKRYAPWKTQMNPSFETHRPSTLLTRLLRFISGEFPSSYSSSMRCIAYRAFMPGRCDFGLSTLILPRYDVS